VILSQVNFIPRDRSRDETTRTCCGPLPSWAPKIKTLEKIENIDFNFGNQNEDITIYILKI
jgi:hypothetical protein